MVNIDLKDRKILYELDLNCRQSNTQIGKKVGLSKEVVSYRIERMQKEGIITHFWTAIDTYKLGYNVFRIYMNFQDVNSEIKDEIIQYFCAEKNSWAVISFKGEIDFDVVFWVKDANEFYQFWNKTLNRFGNYFSKNIMSTLNQVIEFKKTYLLPDEIDATDTEHYRMGCGGETIKIDEFDWKLLNEIVVNARVPLVELAEKLKSSSQTINYRLNNLIKNGIIKAFRVGIDISKFGLQKFSVDIYLKDHSKRKAIYEYLSKKPYVEDFLESVGWSDIQYAAIIENMDKLLQIMDEIETTFPDSIRKQTFLITTKYHKERWLPEL
jgi:DNA-binding Lrp family transcriptional regulator